MSARRSSSRRVVLVVGMIAAVACKVSNEDHCVHRAIESDAWCADAEPERPFCSPCVAAHHGCVAERPTPAACPEYTPDSATDADSGSDASTQ